MAKSMKMAAAVAIASLIVLGTSSCGSDKDVYETPASMAAAAVRAGLPCANPDSEADGSNTMFQCDDGTRLIFAPGANAEALWKQERDLFALISGHGYSEEEIADPSNTKAVLIGNGFTVRFSSDGLPFAEKMADQGGELKNVTFADLMGPEKSWSKVKG